MISGKLPIDAKTIQKKIDLLKKQGSTPENKKLAEDLQKELQGIFDDMKGLLGSLDTSELDNLMLNFKDLCSLMDMDFGKIISDGGDSYYHLALEAGKELFKNFANKITEIDFKTLAAGTSLSDESLTKSKPFIDKVLKDNKINCDTDKLIKKSKDKNNDICKLAATAEKEINIIRKTLFSVVKVVMTAVNTKITEYIDIAPSYTTKFNKLLTSIFDTVKDLFTCEDLTDMVKSTTNTSLKTEIMNCGLKNALKENYSFTDELIDGLSIFDTDKIEGMFNDIGKTLKDSLGNIQLTNIKGFIPMQQASQIAKAISDNMTGENELISSDSEKQTIINTSKEINKSISKAKTYLGGI